jgi:glycosyltransferase involved in cell wall biosynthesis
VDDASDDASAALIQNIVSENPSAVFIPLSKNLGICKAFNQGLTFAKGEYIIDFSTDDVMVPDKISRQVEFFERLDKSYGVIFTDAVYIDEKGKYLRRHFDYLLKKKLIDRIPEGNVYGDVLSTYFIASPSMMVRREVFNLIGGYDEILSYEDFDFWVRSARNFRYAFLNESLIRIRRRKNSMSSGWYKPGDPQLYSTYLVCRKAQHLNKSLEDKSALVKRVKYELRQSVFSQNKREANLFYELLVELNAVNFEDKVTFVLRKLKLPFMRFRNLYHRIRFSEH